MRWALDYASQNGLSTADVSATGHSLGGTAAQLLAATYGVHAETFNAYGAYSIAEHYGYNPDAAMGLVTSRRDVLNPVSRPVGKIARDVICASADGDGGSGANALLTLDELGVAPKTRPELHLP